MDNRFLVDANRKLGRRIGWQLKRYVPDLLEARISVVNELDIDLIIDGGANRGQWASETRRWIPTKILAFEPVLESFESLVDLKLPNVVCEQRGLSNSNGKVQINVSGNLGMASSIGIATDFYKSMYPQYSVSHKEDIEVLTLDSRPDLLEKSIYLKLDVEGHEWQVLNGAIKLLENSDCIKAIELETSIRVTRSGEKSHYELISFLENYGFRVFHLFTPAVKLNGQSNYIDCILTRTKD
jgi:FkbM family methyltransferase